MPGKVELIPVVPEGVPEISGVGSDSLPGVLECVPIILVVTLGAASGDDNSFFRRFLLDRLDLVRCTTVLEPSLFLFLCPSIPRTSFASAIGSAYARIPGSGSGSLIDSESTIPFN